jgi:hypothetical protein
MLSFPWWPKFGKRPAIGGPVSKPAQRRRRLSVQLCLERLEQRVTPATLTVIDAGDPVGLTAGTLRFAIFLANKDAAGATGTSDTIVFQMGGNTVTLSQGPLELSGAGSGTVTIDGGPGVTISGGGASGVFLVDADVQAVLSGLTISNGSATEGGAIYNQGTLTVNGCTITANSAQFDGGGIYNSGSMTINDSTISSNSAQHEFGGGIVNVHGSLSVSHCTISQNHADSTSPHLGAGGGIYINGGMATVSNNSTVSGNTAPDGAGIENSSQGTLTVSNSHVSGNIAAVLGGGIYNESGLLALYGVTVDNNNQAPFGGGLYNAGRLRAVNSILTSNSAQYGGAIDNAGTLTVTNTTLSANHALYGGGGIITAGVATVDNSTLTGNYSQRGGGIFTAGELTISDSTLSNNYTNKDNGGGLYNAAYDALTVSDSTFSGNHAAGDGGGIFNVGTATIGNSTFWNNSANGYGGGAVNDDLSSVSGSPVSGSAATGSLIVCKSTFTGNNAVSGGGGIFSSTSSNSSSTTLENTIVAGNSAATGNDVDTAAGPAAGNNNLIRDGAGMSGISNGSGGNLVGTSAAPLEPRLAALGNYGGPTQTMPLLPDSPALGNGGAAVTILAGAIDGLATSINVANIAAIASTPGTYLIQIESEQILVTDVVGNSLLVTRGYNGTTAAGHANNAAVYLATDQRGLARGNDIGAFQTQGNPFRVTTTADPGGIPGALSLREAVNLANAFAGAGNAETITFDPSLNASTITLSGVLTLQGTGAAETIDGGGQITVSGQSATQVFIVPVGATVSIDGLTIIDGNATDGGGLINFGTLTVTNSSFSGNQADYGGAIYTGNGLLVVKNDTFSGNSATIDSGAVNDFYGGTVEVYSSTFVGNSAPHGGAIGNRSGSVAVTNSTFTGNTASVSGGAIICATGQTLKLGNTIVAGNSAATAPDIDGSITTDYGYNLLGTGVTASGPQDIFSNAPRLTALGSYGGPTQTMALLPDSLALAAGNAAASGLPRTDQRGLARVVNATLDIGAFQTQGGLIVTTTADPGGSFALLSLREAVNLANVLPGNNTISFASSLNGATITVTPTFLELKGSGGTQTIDGGGQITLSGNNNNPIFQTDPGVPHVLTGLTLTAGKNRVAGGAIYNFGMLTVTNSTLTGNSAQYGGGIANGSGGSLTVSNDIFSGNWALWGGGIDNLNLGTLTVNDNCTFIDNFTFKGGEGGGLNNQGTVDLLSNAVFKNNGAFAGGAIANYNQLTASNIVLTGNGADGGAAIFIGAGTLILSNATLSGNISAGDGGAIDNYQGGCTLILTGSTLSGNSAGRDGGGINNGGTLSVTNATLYDNTAVREGGGINNYGGTVAVNDATISGNSASAGGGIATNENGGSLTLQNAIVAGDTAPTAPDIDGSITTDNGYNLLGKGVTAAGPGDISSDSPLLAALGNYGGPTQTMPPLPGSPARGAGNAAAATLPATDQRGLVRLVNGSVDIGAFQTQASAFLVTTLADPAPNSPLGDATGGSLGQLALREAVNLANGYAQVGTSSTITFAAALNGGTIVMSQYQMLLTGSPAGVSPAATETIDGGGQIAVSGNNFTEVFAVLSASADVALTGLGIEHGYEALYWGGGIYNAGTLTLSRDTFSANWAVYGGGIYNVGSLTVNNSLFAANSTTTWGGAIYNIGSAAALTVDHSTFTDNTAPSGGGAIENNSNSLRVVASTFSFNSTSGVAEGGAINNWFNSTASLVESTFDGNSTRSGSTSDVGDAGGAVWNAGALSIGGSTFTNNIAVEGGAIHNYPGATLTVRGTTFSGNSAQHGGAIRNDAKLDLIDTTLSSNSAGSDGGAIFNFGTLTVNNSTLSANSATTGDGGGVDSANSGTLTLQNTILAGNSAPTAPDIGGSIATDSGFNLLGSLVNYSATDPTPGPHDIFSDDPLLTALANNGGPTPTMALAPGSPARSAGNALAAGLPGNDQRGLPRVVNGSLDIGAFQTQTPPIGPPSRLLVTSFPPRIAGTPGTFTVAAVDGFGQVVPSYSGTVSFYATGQVRLPSAATLTNGTGTFSATFFTAGLQTLSVSDGTLSGQQDNIVVMAGAPASVMMVSAPQSTEVNTSFAPLLQVQVFDAYDNAVPEVPVDFTANAGGANGSGAGGTFPGPLGLGPFASAIATTNSTGVATAPVLTANTVAGTFTVTASAAAGAPATFVLTNVPGAPAGLTAVTGSAQSTRIGKSFATPLRVFVVDRYGNQTDGVGISVTFTAPASGPSGIFTAPASGAGGTVTGSGTTAIVVTDSNSMATAPAFTANTEPGNFTVSVTASGLASDSFQLTNIGDPAALTLTPASPQSATVGQAYAATFLAMVTDVKGYPVSNEPVTFTAPSSGASGTFAEKPKPLASVIVRTSGAGVAIAPTFTANTTAGAFHLNVSVAKLPKATFSLTNVAGPLARMAAIGSSSSAAPLTVRATDAFGNPVAGASVVFSASPAAPASGVTPAVFTASAQPATALFAGGAATVLVHTDKHGIASASSLISNDSAGNFTVTVTLADEPAVEALFHLTNKHRRVRSRHATLPA